MAFSLLLPLPFAGSWKVKIRDRERLEPPHVTILRCSKSWRLCLRTGKLLDRDPPERDLPAELLEHVKGQLPQLIEQWNRMYPTNPVGASDDEDE